jgi:hypothetical protein
METYPPEKMGNAPPVKKATPGVANRATSYAFLFSTCFQDVV